MLHDLGLDAQIPQGAEQDFSTPGALGDEQGAQPVRGDELLQRSGRLLRPGVQGKQRGKLRVKIKEVSVTFFAFGNFIDLKIDRAGSVDLPKQVIGRQVEPGWWQ